MRPVLPPPRGSDLIAIRILRRPSAETRAVNRLHELTLTRQQFHSRADENAFRHRGELKECDHALNAGKAALLPRQSALVRACMLLSLVLFCRGQSAYECCWPKGRLCAEQPRRRSRGC